MQLRWFWVLALGTALLLSGQAFGQDSPKPVLKVDAARVPRSATADRYRAEASRSNVQTEATYARALQGKLPTDGKFTPPQEPRQRTDHAISGPTGLILVFALLLGGLALWLRFGGAGGLLAAGPGEIKTRHIAPEGWKMPDSQGLPSGDVFALIQGMADRRAAIVLLLRASLMRAAEISDTRFARSDTEREALRRLPKHLYGRPVLADLLQQAELAHYGGREVSPDLLASSIARARALFGARA